MTAKTFCKKGDARVDMLFFMLNLLLFYVRAALAIGASYERSAVKKNATGDGTEE